MYIVHSCFQENKGKGRKMSPENRRLNDILERRKRRRTRRLLKGWVEIEGKRGK